MNALTISFLSALTALFASIVGPSVSVYVARRQINANILSASRQKWIEQMRDLVGSLVAQLAAAIGVVDGLDEDALQHFARDHQVLQRIEHLVTTMAKIRLMLNSHEPDHAELFRTVDTAINLLGKPGNTYATLEPQMKALAETILQQTEIVLRKEWVRVKKGK